MSLLHTQVLLDTTYKWHQAVVVFLCLICPTWRNAVSVHGATNGRISFVMAEDCLIASFSSTYPSSATGVVCTAHKEWGSEHGGADIFLCEFVSFGCIPKWNFWIAGCGSFFVCWRTCVLFSLVAELVHIPPPEFPVLQISTNTTSHFSFR